jgi:carbon starvation protein
VWLVTITTAAAWEKLFNEDVRIGFLSHARDLTDKLADGSLVVDAAAQAETLIFNDRLDAGLTLFFLLTTWVLVIETVRVCYATLAGRGCLPSSETDYVVTQLHEV